uniref:uncharacterized protein LOC122610406 n=1 Tax=Erigeron canadensis TaxID=72917 RepID=UPI001CB9430A|nr:uncharacterized protein LOC122610406 [Erigeron canadensis]
MSKSMPSQQEQGESEGTVDEEIEMEPNTAEKIPAVPSKNVEKPHVETPPVKPYQPKVPFPQRLRQGKIKENFKKFVELIQNVNISVPLVDLLAGMPNYAKFLKDLISDRKKLQEDKTAVMSAEVSAIIKNEIPPKLDDPGNFLISCSFGLELYKALADLGASINLMPYSVYKKLSLEMEADINVPLILGRPFLMTADAIIRVKAKEISLGVGDDRVVFNVDKALKHPYSYGMIRRCVADDETRQILDACHHGPTGGHYGASVTGKKVYDAGFFWPTVFKEAQTLVEWAEARALPTNDARVVIHFLKKLFCRFGVPKALISDRGSHVANHQLAKVLKRYGVNHRFNLIPPANEWPS